MLPIQGSTSCRMVRNQRVRTARAAGGQKAIRNGQLNPPCAKIIVRLRPVLQDELASGETQSALTTTRRGEVKLKLQTTCGNRGNTGDGQQKQQQQREGLPTTTTMFQVDTVLGPGNDTSEVYATAASRLVDRAITGGKALLLIAGTPGSGRSHTLWGAPQQHHSTAATSVAAAGAATGMEEQGLLPLALADLSRRWTCGNGSPFYHSSSAAAATTESRRFPSSLSTPAQLHSRSPLAPPLAFRLCVAEVSPGGRENSNNKAGAARDLLRCGSSSVVSSRPSPGGGGGDRDIREKKGATSSSPSPPKRWALSAREALVGLMSSSFSPSPPVRSSFARSGHRLSGGGARKSRAWMGMGRGRGGVAAEAERSLLASRVLEGVDEVSAEGVEEALALVREGLSKRRREGHLVISVKLVAARGDDVRVEPTPQGITETGELVFIELGDCPNDGLPQTLRNALSFLKIGYDHQDSLGPQTPPASRSTCAAVTGTTGALPIPGKQRSGIIINNNNNNNNNNNADNLPNNDSLRAVLSAFVDPGPGAADTLTLAADNPVKGVAATAATATSAAVTGTTAGGSRWLSLPPGGGRGATAATVAAGGAVGAGAVRSVHASAVTVAAASDGPLVVSVVATLRSGDACYREDKALLEALAKSSRVRPESWRRLPLGRVLASMASFPWWSSHTGPATAAADDSAPAPAPAAAPSAPPVPSSEEVSLAMSNYSSSRSASSSLSNACGEEVSAATVAVSSACGGGGGGDGGASAGLYAAAENDVFDSPAALKEAASVAADVDGMDVSSTGGSLPGSSRGGAAVPTHLEERSSTGKDDGAGVLATGGQDELPRRSQDGRRTGDSDGSGAGLLTIEGADEAADKHAAGGARAGQKNERRVSPPWDDSTLGLLGLTRDELIDRVLQAERESRQWKAQHALVERRMAAILAPTESQKTGSKGGGGVGPSRLPPMVGGATGSQGSVSPPPAGRSPERLTGCSPKERNYGEGSGALAAVSPCGTSAVTSPDTTEAVHEANGAQAREHHGRAEGEERGASGSDGKGEEKTQSASLTPGTAAVDRSSTVKELPSSRVVSGGGVQSMSVRDFIADHPPRSRVIDNGEPKNVDDSSSPQPLTFKERRAVFSSNNSVPVPPAAVSLPWSVVANAPAAAAAADVAATSKAANMPPSPRCQSPPRAGTRASPPLTVFSSSAVTAARQNLERVKVLSKRGSTVTTGLRLRERERDGYGEPKGKGEGSCVSSDSRLLPHAALSVSSMTLSRGTSSVAACSLSKPLFTPPRPLHYRRTSAPSPPAPSPCITADRYKITQGIHGSSTSSASGTSGARSGGKLSLSEEPSPLSPWSSSFPCHDPPSTASSPQFSSPPSFPKPNAERRRARAQSMESGKWSTVSSLSMASSVLQSPVSTGTASALASEAPVTGASWAAGAAAADVAARLPPTAPSAAPRRKKSMPVFTAAATSASPAATSGSSASSFPCWSGTVLRQKSFGLQHSPASALFSSTFSPLPSPLPEESDTRAVSAASRVPGKGQRTTGVHHGFGGGGSGSGGSGDSGCGKTTEGGLPSSKGVSVYPHGEVALSRTSFRSGDSGGGGGGRLEDDWNERPTGVGPWPLIEETREGRASPHEKRDIAIGSDGHLFVGCAEKVGTPGATAAATQAAADPEVSIGNISSMQASRLRALREKMERRYWPRGVASETAMTTMTAMTAKTAANPPLASNTEDASAIIPEGPESLDGPACLGRRSSPVLRVKPWGRQRGSAEQRSSTGAAVQAQQDDGGRPLRNVSERM